MANVMTMTLTDATTDITWAIYKLLEDNKEALGLRMVFDGDRSLVSETPCISVIASDKTRELVTTGLGTDINFAVTLMLYHKRIQTEEMNEREVQELAEAVEDFLHLRANQTLGGLVIFGMITRVEPGYATRTDSVMRTTRMTWEARSRAYLPMN